MTPSGRMKRTPRRAFLRIEILNAQLFPSTSKHTSSVRLDVLFILLVTLVSLDGLSQSGFGKHLLDIQPLFLHMEVTLQDKVGTAGAYKLLI